MQTESVNNSVVVKQKICGYDMRFDDIVTTPNYYRFELEALQVAEETTPVTITVNSDGGSLATGIEMVNEIIRCKADVTGILRSSCHSCGSIIFLACDSHEVGLASEMLLHAGAGGNFGTPSQSIQRAESYKRQVRALFETVYKGFLSDEELDLMIENDKEFIFCSEEIEGRLQAMYKYRQDCNEGAIMEAMNQQFEEEDALVEQALAELNISVEEREVFEKINSKLEKYFSQGEQPSQQENLLEIVSTLEEEDACQSVTILDVNADPYGELFYRWEDEELVDLELIIGDEDIIPISVYALEDYPLDTIRGLMADLGVEYKRNQGKKNLSKKLVTYLEECVE